MACALVQSVVKTVSSSSPVTITLTQATTIGNVVVVVYRGTYTALSGGGVSSWQTNVVQATRIAWGLCDSSSSTITFTGGRSDSGCFQVAEFSGVTYAASGVAPLVTASGTSTAPSSGNISPASRSLLIGGIEAASAVWSSGLSGWTEFGEIAGQGGSILRPAWRVTDAGTYAMSGTLSSSVLWSSAVLALAEAASGGGSSRNASSLGMMGVG